MFILRVDMHSHGIHVSITTARKSWRSGCILPVDSKMIGRNLRPFCAHMGLFLFIFLVQALSAARRFYLASFTVSLYLALGPGSGWTTVVSKRISDVLPSGLSGTNGRLVCCLPSCLISLEQLSRRAYCSQVNWFGSSHALIYIYIYIYIYFC